MDQMGLFDLIPDTDDGSASKGKITVVNAQFLSSETVWGHELFDGFHELYAITYSTGIPFMCSVIDKFDYAEIIFGCEGLVDDGLAAAMSVNAKVIDRITKNKNYKKICERMDEEKLRLYVSRTTKSHEKVFCLRAKDGRTRVITGSANMSTSAFFGLQRENIVCFNDTLAFETYKHWYDVFRENCSDHISHKVLLRTSETQGYLEEHIEEIPVFQTLEKRQMLVLETHNEEETDYEIIADIKGMESELKPMIPKPKREGGKLLFTAEHIQTLKAKFRGHQAEKKIRQKRLPKLHVDYDLCRMDFNGEPCNLTPDREKVQSDIGWLFTLLGELKIFYGDVADAQREYYAFLNWYFSSIFAPYLRYVASRNDGVPRHFPTVGIIYGDSDGGKSTFLQLLTKLMCGVKVPLNSSSDFTATNIENLRRACEGVPIVIDDLDKTQFKSHADKIIKDDEWGIAEHFIHYPAIAITTNKLPSLEDAISKRAVGCRISIKINKEQGMKNAKRINQCIKNVGNSFFCEYVRRMLPKIGLMTEQLKNEKETESPDLFAVSSAVLMEIFEDFVPDKIPTYARLLTQSDYFGDRVVGKNAIRKIISAWENEPTQFRVDKKKNRLIYTYPENANTYELRYICDELPAVLNAKYQAKSLYMDLDAAREFFELRFKKTWFGSK